MLRTVRLSGSTFHENIPYFYELILRILQNCVICLNQYYKSLLEITYSFWILVSLLIY